jgi:hypothetical protein
MASSPLAGHGSSLFNNAILRDDSLNAFGSFNEGLGIVFRIHDGHRRYGYADFKGEVKIEAQYGLARSFNDGLAQVGPVGNRLSGFITKDGVSESSRNLLT